MRWFISMLDRVCADNRARKGDGGKRGKRREGKRRDSIRIYSCEKETESKRAKREKREEKGKGLRPATVFLWWKSSELRRTTGA
jgi:hypothetical protein